MKQNEASVTSLVSAFARAYHSQYDSPTIFDDFMAKELISQEESSMIKENMIQGISFFSQEIAQNLRDQPDEMLKWITQVQLSPTPLARAAFCERVLHNEIILGVKQYVILGAGLDTFSFRHPELENKIEVFEIDHPATQEFKKKRLDETSLQIPKNLHFIPIDFTNMFSTQDLMNKGFDVNQKTFFSFLGVSYYLTKEEIFNLFTHIFTRLPSGSSIVFDFADEKLFSEKGFSNRVENMLKMASVGGEPMKSCFSYTEIESLLEKAGLLIYEHLSPTDINEMFFKNRSDYLSAFENIHYIHAVKN
ncbi:class I SAM-dependent methyltransferase [Bacillus sp. ISL-35]|uniref:class I SAM-dependent methyltransferase n=1 Tax=Bacillus sp. ISL-35 TaxID=2819122 RepID=UPI001BE6EA37|nr:class I SAM-dependent methyltransferase [Bacillus sp. ISL-35]MBT2681594.1 class I SAM-dependent methyltransferase [Bacillus sp. ISL-35]MBT2705132.1 class I SAM-dependent methyltransferase [Chryseobacterium sp. ISL-80]